MNLRQRTIQDRIAGHPALEALARLNAEAETGLLVELGKGRKFPGDIATSLYRPLGISAKNLDHIHAALKGRIDSVRECAVEIVRTLVLKIKAKKRDISTRKAQISRVTNMIARELRKRSPDMALIDAHKEKRRKAKAALHQHNRRLSRLHVLLARAEARMANPTICFGSRALMRARSRLDRNDAVGPDGRVMTDGQRRTAIAEWRREWDRRRGGEIFVPGDASVSCGNLFVKVESRDDGAWTLILRLPRALSHLVERTFRHGSSDVHEVAVGTVRFLHGGEEFRRALTDKHGPITWRIQRHDSHDGSWVVSCSFKDAIPEIRDAGFGNGALGVDFNADHLALALTDGRGCFVKQWTLPLDTQGLSSDQTLDLCRKTAKQIAEIAWEHHVPVVAESLDFGKKKASVTTGKGPTYARMLHALPYVTFGAALDSACARRGVRLERVNPAYTSLIGYAKFARSAGLGIHHAAAVAIARRGQNFSERLPIRVGISLPAGAHGTLPRPEVSHGTGIAKAGRGPKPIPARRHVWVSWSAIAKERKATIRGLLRERDAGASGRIARSERRALPPEADQPGSDPGASNPRAVGCGCGAGCGIAA